jgi:ligand-binding SRPBCC domain-containing protein
MPTYERETRVAAPLDDVWEFHRTVRGLTALTPDWMGLRVESLCGPDGEPLDREDTLVAGSRVSLSVRPFGVGPRQSWTSVIRARERSGGAAFFRDEMVDGPFTHWVHTHAFYADDGETLLRDRVEYRLPLGAVGDIAGPLAVVGFEPMFRERHRRTRRRLEA